MPYKGNETLIFSSDNGDIDTIFFLKKDTIWRLPNLLSNSIKYEEVSILCRHTNSAPSDDRHSYLVDDFVILNKSIDGKARLDLQLSAKDAGFLIVDKPRIDSLDKLIPTTLQTKYKTYNDVYVFDATDWNNSKQYSNYVTKAYWSKSEGLVRYDKMYSVYWELTKKYSP